MNIPYSVENNEIIQILEGIDLEKLFSIIQFGKTQKDIEKKATIESALALLSTYASSHTNHAGKFLSPPLEIQRKNIPV